MNCRIGQIRYDLFQLNESDETGLNADCYLLIGKEKAAVIDALQTADDLYDKVRSITDLPLELFIGHAHPDHAGTAVRRFHEEGVRIWMNPADLFLLKMFQIDLSPEWFTPLEDQKEFDLGGISLKSIYLPGHTPGSTVFLDEQNQRLFSSDAVGSGSFWMQIPGCTRLSTFHSALLDAYSCMHDMKQLKIYPGHRYQSPVQLNLQYLKDTLTLTEMILEHRDESVPMEMELAGKPLPFRKASYGMMLDYCYNPLNL